MGNLRVPLSTYRLQFNKGFRFEDALTILPYLQRLGISDLYASPILKARQGSPHGYDVTDPSRLNPELGTETDFEQLSEELRGRSMGLILDIVPNHMAIGVENRWWMDALENGLASPFADFFDIYWQQTSDGSAGKVLLPILGAPPGEVLEARQLRLVLEDDCLFIRYYETSLPLDIKSYSLVVSRLWNSLQKGQSANHPVSVQFKKMLDAMERLPGHGEPNTTAVKRSYPKRQRLKREFRQIVSTNPKLRALILEKLALFNEAPAASGTAFCMEGMLERQAYQLAFWRTGTKDINYRRFFDINDLIGVRVEHPKVFKEMHSLITRLVHEGKVTGLRVDHIDGLKDPQGYLRRLKAHLLPKGAKTPRLSNYYVVVEKILIGEESLPLSWPVFGTTGYDFLHALGNVFVDPKGFHVLEDSYRRLTECTATFDDTVYAKKKQVMEELFSSEIKMLGHRLADLAERTHGGARLSRRDAVDCLVEATACLPVYRTYIRTYNVSTEDSGYLKQAFEKARRRGPPMGHRAL